MGLPLRTTGECSNRVYKQDCLGPKLNIVWLQSQTLSSSNRFLCASKTSVLADGRPGLAEDCGFSEEADGEDVEDDFSAASFSEAALITGLWRKTVDMRMNI